MRALRAIVRTVLSGLSTIAAVVVLTPVAALGRVAPRARTHWNNLVFRAWSRFNLALLGARVEVTGRPPEVPFFLVANHLSYIDILVLASRLDAVFVSKAEVRHWPLMGWASRLVRTIFIDRDIKRDIPRVLAEIDDRLRYGQGVVVFPEGMSSAGSRLHRFRPPLLEAAARGRHPVSYASLAYRALPGENPAYLSVCWWGTMTFVDHYLRLLGTPGFEVALVFGGEPVCHEDRKQLAMKLHGAVECLFEPTAPPSVGLGDA